MGGDELEKQLHICFDYNHSNFLSLANCEVCTVEPVTATG